MPGLLTDIVLAVGGFQLYLLAAVTLTRRGGRSLPRYLFAAFLLTKALLITRWFCYRYEILTVPDHRVLYYYSASLFFLLAPFLYLYVRSLCYRDFRVALPSILHALPLLFPLVLTAIGLEAVGRNSATALVERRYWDLFWGANLLQILLYILAMLRVVRDYRSELREVYSSVEGIDLKWLTTLLAVIAFYWIFISSRAALSFLGADLPLLIALLDLFSITIFLVFTTALAFRGLARIRVFDGVEKGPKRIPVALSEEEVGELAGKLRGLMETRKLYLTPSLTIDDLSAELGVPSRRLSHVIHAAFGRNFHGFVNGYRVEEAKNRLSDPKARKATVLQILLDVGFNSKSAFNEAFRRHAGMTPREFKKAHPG